jgi:hypothetical protein
MPPAFADNLTDVRAWRSYHSQTCPACGKRKPERLVVCIPCVERLSPEDREIVGYAKFSLSDFRAAIAHALASLDRATVIDPPPARPCRKLALSMLSNGRLEESRSGRLCPACAGSKPTGKGLCAYCLTVLRTHVITLGTKVELKDLPAAWSAWEFYLSKLRIDTPSRRIGEWRKAFRSLGLDGFYIQV